jgi:hypothetical protein
MNVDAVAARHSRRRKHHRHQFNSSLLSGEVAVKSNVKHVASSSHSGRSNVKTHRRLNEPHNR